MWDYLLESTGQRWALALVHFLWQGALVAGLLAVALTRLRSATAQSRYGVCLLALGVLGVYIFRIFQEVLARPRYVIDETVNVEGTADGRP